MKTIKTKIIELPTFEQLTDIQKQKVIENYSDINVDSVFWFEHIIDEAKELGFKIKEFDTYRKTINAKFTKDAVEVANTILKEHGEACETYKSARNFLEDYNKVATDDDAMQDAVVAEFEDYLSDDYLNILCEQYEYCTSEEAIIETLILNEYTFNAETLQIDA
jgi:hypothetical protein